LELRVNLDVAVCAHEKASIEFGFDLGRRTGVALGRYAKFLMAIDVVKRQSVQAPIVSTSATPAALVENRLLFQVFPSSGDVKLELAGNATEAPLPSGQLLSTPMPRTIPFHSRLLYH
jgi:hypothetical protein